MTIVWETEMSPLDVNMVFNNTTYENTSNSSLSGGRHESRFSLTEMVVIIFIASMLSMVTVAGNVMVMISFKIDKQLQTISNYFLFSLAVADFTVGLISMPLFTVYTVMGYWPLGAHLCDAWLALDYLASNASVLNLLLISFDRYFSVTRPLTYRAKRSPVKAGFMIIGAWGVSLLLWPPWIYAWPYIEGKRTVPDDDCYIQFIQTNQYITFGTAIAAFYVPVTVMIVLYWLIWKETEKRQKDLPNLQGGKANHGKRSASKCEEPSAAAETEGWARVRTSSNTISADCEAVEVPYNTRHYIPHVPKNRERTARPFTWAWVSECCIAWWHSGHDEYEMEDYWDDTASEAGIVTPVSGETPVQSSVSRCTSLNVIKEMPSTSSTHVNIQEPCSSSTQQENKSGPSLTDSNESIYTIIIRLPEESTGEAPSVKMFPETSRKRTPPSAISTPVSSTLKRDFPSSSQTSLPPPMTRRPSNIADLRTPLNPKVISKPVIGAKNVLPIKLKPLPKKKKKPMEKKADKKAAKTLSAILLAFIITWTPYNILVLLKPLTAFPEYISKGLWDFFYYLCYINSTINPLCYALCNASFRRTYVRILCCKWKKKHRIAAMNRGFYN